MFIVQFLSSSFQAGAQKADTISIMPWIERFQEGIGRVMDVAPTPNWPPQRIGPIRDVQEAIIVNQGKIEKRLTMWVGPHPDCTKNLNHAQWGTGWSGPEYPVVFDTTVDGDGERTKRNLAEEEIVARRASKERRLKLQANKED